MMTEALTRRFQRTKAGDWEAPDLLVVDGGKGQLKMATTVLADLGITDVPVIGLAKSRVINDEVDTTPEKSPERVFIPGIKDAIVLRQNSAPLYLLARLRDEAHRFAITFHRQTRRKKRLTSALDRIDGIGPTRRKALLQHFGSLSGVKGATVDALREVRGISESLAHRIHAILSEG